MVFFRGVLVLYDVGYANAIRIDQEESFCSDLFKMVKVAQGIELQFSGVEIHNYIGAS